MASRSVNRVCVLGNLGRDAATTFTPSGASKTTFSVACSRRWKDQSSGEWKEATDWVSVVAWRKENLANHLVKGTSVYVEGRLQTDKYDDKEGRTVYQTYVNADEIILLGGKGERQAQSDGQMPRSTEKASDGWDDDPAF